MRQIVVNQPTLGSSSSSGASSSENAPTAQTSADETDVPTTEPMIPSSEEPNPISEQQNDSDSSDSPTFDAAGDSSSDEEIETVSNLLNSSAGTGNQNEASSSGT